jgi:hypothetical protein
LQLALIVSYGLFFYLQTITENDIKNILIQQQRLRQIESTKAISQNIGSDLDSIMARLQMRIRSADCREDSFLIVTQEHYWRKVHHQTAITALYFRQLSLLY